MSSEARRAFVNVDKKYTALDLAYADSSLVMTLVKSNAPLGASSDMRLDPEEVQALIKNMTRKQVDVFLPKFRFDVVDDFKSTLRELGMQDAFDSNCKADFTKIHKRQKCEENLYIDAVVHKTSVGVNEKGTEAGAASAVAITRKGIGEGLKESALVVDFNKPFMFFIRERSSNTILLIG